MRSNLVKSLIGRFLEKKLKESTGTEMKIFLKYLDISHSEDGVPGATIKIELEGMIKDAELNKLITKLGF